MSEPESIRPYVVTALPLSPVIFNGITCNNTSLVVSETVADDVPLWVSLARLAVVPPPVADEVGTKG